MININNEVFLKLFNFLQVRNLKIKQFHNQNYVINFCHYLFKSLKPNLTKRKLARCADSGKKQRSPVHRQ